jgi:hypothetical protein
MPAARSFKRPNLVREVLSERGRYVSAALTIVRAWIAAGSPRNVCKHLAGYDDWSELCRQPLLWLGLPDPAESLFEAIAEDPDRETLDRFLTAWHADFGSAPTMVRDVVARAVVAPAWQNVELRDVIQDIAGERGEVNRRRLGRYVSRNVGRIVNGRRFKRAKGNSGAEAWQVELVSQVS